jgi:hypothetical protein
MTRPAMSIAMELAPACSAQPKMEMIEPMKTVFFLPSMSATMETESEPMMAPPVKEDTIPPAWSSEGFSK